MSPWRRRREAFRLRAVPSEHRDNRLRKLAAGFAERRITVCVKNVAANEIAEGCANEGVGCKVVVCCETSH